MAFSESELSYLRSQRLGRLATLGFGSGVIRIHPETIFAFGLDPTESGMTRRSA